MAKALLARETFECAFAVNVQVFHGHLRGFAIGADGDFCADVEETVGRLNAAARDPLAGEYSTA